MYLNYRRIINTDSKVVHAVHKNGTFTLCGYPDGAYGYIGVDFIVNNWANWKDSKKKPTCLRCKASLAKIKGGK